MKAHGKREHGILVEWEHEPRSRGKKRLGVLSGTLWIPDRVEIGLTGYEDTHQRLLSQEMVTLAKHCFRKMNL